MTRSHWTPITDLAVMPAKIIISVVAPHRLGELAIGARGVSAALTCLLWQAIYNKYLFLTLVQFLDDPIYTRQVRAAYSVEFANEIVMLIQLLIGLAAIAVPSFVIQDRNERQTMISLFIIVAFFVTFWTEIAAWFLGFSLFQLEALLTDEEAYEMQFYFRLVVLPVFLALMLWNAFRIRSAASAFRLFAFTILGMSSIILVEDFFGTDIRIYTLALLTLIADVASFS